MPDSSSHQNTSAPVAAGSEWVLRLALRFGVGIGLAYAVWLLGLHLTGNNAFGPKRLVAQFAIPPAVVASQWMLRRVLRPAKPGLGRALAVGGLTAVLAATLAATSVYGLGVGVGESAMTRTRTELLEIARSQKTFLMKQLGSEAAYNRNIQQVQQLTLSDIARDDFSKILVLGMLVAIPAGIFLRE